jgi:hypothetical protein
MCRCPLIARVARKGHQRFISLETPQAYLSRSIKCHISTAQEPLARGLIIGAQTMPGQSRDKTPLSVLIAARTDSLQVIATSSDVPSQTSHAGVQMAHESTQLPS